MQHLTPVGLSRDGSELVLVSDTGEEFAVPVDHRFRTALRGDQARLGQLEMKMESALRPRDIQSRIRGGETAEQVAAAAQTTVDAIMAFAAPVLAERAHVAQTALKSSIRRATTEASPVARTLDEASRQHLTTVGVRSDDVEWDAWRREDGRWSLVAEYIAGNDLHRAEFVYDPPGRYVLAENDQARLLTGETVHAAPAPEPGRRLSSVPTGTDDELPLGDDAIALVREPEPAAEVEPDAEPEIEPEIEPVVEPVVEAMVAEPVVQAEPVVDDLASDHADADWIVTEPTEPTDVAPAAEQDAAEPTEPVAAEPAPAKKKGRSSVPSWDEIMFGGGKHE
ncbi:MAG: septation protein SepH [Propionibacteriales bacterium]|nr:septation protein SepH [Propionibacteriales bacterium]